MGSMSIRTTILAHRALTAVVALLWAGSVGAQLNCNVGIEFRDDGRLRACVLNGHHRIYTESGVAVTCADGARLEQHRDGTLERCTLAAPAVLDDRQCAAGSQVVFGTDGRLLHCKAGPSG